MNILMPIGLALNICGIGYMMILDVINGEYYGIIQMTIGTPIFIVSSNHAKVFTISYNLGSMRRTALFEMECDRSGLSETVETFLNELRKYNGAIPIIRRGELWCPNPKYITTTML